MTGVHVRQAMPAEPQRSRLSLGRERDYPAPALRAEHVRAEGFGASPRFLALLAELAGQPVGYALFYPAYDTDRAALAFYRAIGALPRDRRARGEDPDAEPAARRAAPPRRRDLIRASDHPGAAAVTMCTAAGRRTPSAVA